MKINDKIKSFYSSFKKGISLLFDQNIPFSYKLIPVLGLLYVLHPFDFIADFIPVLGQMDDLAIMGGALGLFAKMAEKYKNRR